jgi:hypothetical protein
MTFIIRFPHKVLAIIFVALLLYVPADIIYRRCSIQSRNAQVDGFYDKGLYNAFEQFQGQRLKRQDVFQTLGNPDWQKDSFLIYCHHDPSDPDTFLLGQLPYGANIFDTTSLVLAFDSSGKLVGRRLMRQSRWWNPAACYDQFLKNEQFGDLGQLSNLHEMAKDDIERRLAGVKVRSITCSPSTGNVAFADKKVYDVRATCERDGKVGYIVTQYADDNSTVLPPPVLNLQETEANTTK